MKLNELIKELNIISMNAGDTTEITGINYDSRKVQPGDLFVAVRGFSSDGHAFIPKAVSSGAAAVICEQVPEIDIPYILVADSRLALALVSAAYYCNPSQELKVIGVTGTSGKTTSTHLIKHILEHALGVKVGLVGTNGNMIGDEFIHTEFTTPESLELQGLFRRMLDAGCTYAVMEVSSHSIALERIGGIKFSTAAFTNLSQDHLDFHGTMDEYARTKRKLFDRCVAACINIDDARGEEMMAGVNCSIITTSCTYDDAGIFADNIRLSAEDVRFEAVSGGERAEVKLNIPGSFSVYNALTAISCCISEGVSLEKCAEALAVAKGVKGRVETVPSDGDYSIIIDYSHKPDALEKVLKTLRPVTRGRLVCLFGCGGDRDRKKRPIMGSVAADNSDLCIVTSDNPRTEEPQAIINEILEGMKHTQTPVKVICDRVEAICWAIDNACAGDVILLAGKGHEDYQIIGHEKRHLDEREVVAEHIIEKRRS